MLYINTLLWVKRDLLLDSKIMFILHRNLVDANNCGSEADLYGLVSDILEEPDSVDPYSSYVSEK